MKVLLITQTLTPQSGLGRYSKGVYDGLLAKNIPTCVMSEDGHIPLKVKKTFSNFIKNCMLARRVAKEFDVVHALDAWPYGVYGLCAVLGTGKGLFSGGVGTYSVPPKGISLKRSLLIAFYKRVKKVFCISKYTKERIAERIQRHNHLQVVHLATEPLGMPKGDAHKQFSIPKSACPVFITVGEVKERKGQLDTLKGLAKLKNKYPSFIYLIVGSLADTFYANKIRSEAKRLGVSNNLIFLDSIKNDTDLALLYSIADIHFLNSNNQGDHFEGFGLVFLEANQFGVPGVGSKNCGIEDAINDGVSGILVDQKDHNGIANAVIEILKNKKVFEKGAKDWYTHFSWGKTVEKYIEEYKR